MSSLQGEKQGGTSFLLTNSKRKVAPRAGGTPCEPSDKTQARSVECLAAAIVVAPLQVSEN